MNIPRSTVCSFDLFDTLLTRKVGEPHAVFLLAGQVARRKNIITTPATEFKRARTEAERSARQAEKDREVTLAIIYDKLAVMLGLAPETTRTLMQIELEIEDSTIEPIKFMQAEVAAARERFGPVLFISDMYLPAEFLRQKLISSGFLMDGDKLMVSSDYGVTKSSGKLFAKVLEAEKLCPDNLVHCGDNRSSDVAVPQKMGIRVKPFKRALLNRYEYILERHSDATDGLSSLLAGASRLARLETSDTDPKTSAIRDVAAGVAGPALFAYVVWILQQAKAKKMRRIFFLARDGQAVLKVAKIVAPRVGYTGELRYLYASRQSWRLPATEANNAESICWAFEDTDFISVKSFLARLGLRPPDVAALLMENGFPENIWGNGLSAEERKSLFRLAESPEFLAAVGEAAAKLRATLMAYLRQEGVLTGTPFGIVDLGWHGSLQFALEQLLRRSGNLLPAGFYFALNKGAKNRDLGDAAAFFYDERFPESRLSRDYWIEPMMEVFCAADHGMTLFFETTSGRADPVLKAPRNLPALAWGLEIQQQAIIDFTNRASEHIHPDIDTTMLRPAINNLLSEFWNRPTRAEAAAFGVYPYADDQTESLSRQFGEPFRLYDALRSAWRGKLTPPSRAGWGPGGLIRSSPVIRFLTPAATRLGSWWRQRQQA